MRRDALKRHRHLWPILSLAALWLALVILLSGFTAFMIYLAPSETSDPSAPNLELPPTIEPDTRSRPIATVDENGATVITEDTAPREEPRS